MQIHISVCSPVHSSIHPFILSPAYLSVRQSVFYSPINARKDKGLKWMDRCKYERINRLMNEFMSRYVHTAIHLPIHSSTHISANLSIHHSFIYSFSHTSIPLFPYSPFAHPPPHPLIHRLSIHSHPSSTYPSPNACIQFKVYKLKGPIFTETTYYPMLKNWTI